MNAASLGHVPRKANNLPYCVPQLLLRLFSCCIFSGYLPCLLSKRSPKVLQTLQEPITLTLKLQTLHSADYKNQEIQALLLSKPTTMEIHFPHVFPCVTFCLSQNTTMASSLRHQPRSVSPPNHISTLPTFLSVASSPPLVVEFVLPVFRSISGVFKII